MLVHKNIIKFLNYLYSRDSKFIPENWNIILDTKDINIDLFGFDAVAFINKDSKYIIIGHKGTLLDIYNFKQLYHDIAVWFDIYKQAIPYQFIKGGSVFLDQLINKIGTENIHNYKILNIGHSTGGVNSDLSTAYINNLGIKAFSITYENPGSKPILEKFAINKNIDIEQFKANFKVYNAQESRINELNEHFGELIRLNYPCEPSDGLLSKTAFTLGKIGEMLWLAHKAYALYVNFDHTILHRTLDEGYLNTHNPISSINILSAVATGLVMVSEKVNEIDKALTTHNFDNMNKIIEDSYIEDNIEADYFTLLNENSIANNTLI